ncbi:MAG: LLM class flavin-dependent oxidoreductase [Pararhodobacter sp.]|nr:LLM class flavin-dependent oxidoreductase [Pararhodobacter sp.]
MLSFSAVLVGHETLLVQCGEALIRRGHRIAAVVSDSADVVSWAETSGLALIAPGPGLEARLVDAVPEGFDWLFSIGNTRLLDRSVLEMARGGAINFHDGPLPRYAGLNAPVWGLLNRESTWGITWHMITPGVDMGDIVEQVMFDIDPAETALSLNTTCFARGLESFPAVVAGIESGALRRMPQDMSQRSQVRRDDRPAGAGRLDFARPADHVARFVRALDHGGYRNPICLPKVETEKGAVAVVQAEVIDGQGAAAGTVLAVGADSIQVACGKGVVRLGGLTCLQGMPVDPASFFDLGDVLVTGETRALDAALARIVPGEAHWGTALAAFKPAGLTGIAEPDRMQAAARTISVDLPHTVTARRAAAVLAAYSGLDGAGCGMAYANAELVALCTDAPADIMPWVPMQPEGDCLADLEGVVCATAEVAARFPGFARDLIARDPDLGPIDAPVIGLSESGLPIAGCVLTVVQTPDGARLVADAHRTDAAFLDIWAARIAHLAAVDAEAALTTLDLLSPAEKSLLDALNDPAQDFDHTATINRMFEAQAARSPDAIALVYENTALSYHELDARANKVAHVLQQMGVGPDVPVALCMRRSPEMMIAALGILKAGGAYVPMDPAYPADRLAHYLKDSAAPVIVTQTELVATMPPHAAELLVIDTDPRLADAPDTVPATGPTADNLAYLIYTSGSTGLPKGVMIEHRNVVNFFTGMDARIDHAKGGVWLALTSLNFDISVLELFWTLARGFKVVLTSDEDRLTLSSSNPVISEQKMAFSLFYWGNDDGPGPKKYELLLEGARFADTHGFCAVWTPERHFHAFGGPYPNPSITGAAVAAVTRNIGVRAGSVVAPLHHPLRIAEEWAVIDNLTGGRAGLGIASGWHPVDFVLRPENAPPNNKTAMYDTIDKVRRLWRGEEVAFDRGGEMVPVQSLPRPVSRELPLWLTIAGNPDTWREAGEIGANVLTHLLGQSIDDVARMIGVYHEALRKSGRDPADHTVTLMLHTYVARSRELARETARGPMKSYLLAAAGLVKQYAWSFPAFKRPEGATSPMDIDLRSLSQEEVDGVLDYAFNRYFEESGLFGTVEDCLARVEQLKQIGVGEVACLIDYGIASEQVLEGLYPLAEVLRRANAPVALDAHDFSLAAQMRRHKVTHLQCTPSMARLLLADEGARAALSQVAHVMIGGEALPGALAETLQETTGRPVQNMYGPTETTIWSTTGIADGNEAVARLGKPIANTVLRILDDSMRPVPVGVPGELWIGGAGVARGYWQREALTADRFRSDPAGAGRLYGTGDMVRLDPDGGLTFLGRADGQVKIRGHRIELGEIEAVLEALAGVSQACVVARPDDKGGIRLLAYVTGCDAGRVQGLMAEAAVRLPAPMRPARIITLDAFPLTPNKKVDRKALPLPEDVQKNTAALAPAAHDVAGNSTMREVAAIWTAVLGVPQIGPGDSFFALGGHSLLAVHAHREMREKLALPGLSITDIFRFPVLSALVNHIDTRLRPIDGPVGNEAPEKAATDAAQTRIDAMSRRKAMRAQRMSRTG